MKNLRTEKLVLASLMAAMTTVGTMLIKVPAIKGYIHIGDSIVYLCGILLGPVLGGIAAGLGSFIADMLLGYAVYAPATFMIKGLDAMLVGFIYFKLLPDGASIVQKTMKFIIAVVAGGIVMVGGYFVYEVFLYGVEGAAAGIAYNVTQAVGGGILAYPLLIALDKVNLVNKIKKKTSHV